MICFAWSGFPQYAARCVGAFVRQCNCEVVVVATRPKVPIEGMESLCGCDVFWIDGDDSISNMNLKFDVDRIDVLVVSGWSIPVFNRLTESVRSKGGKIICMVDNNFVYSVAGILKESLKSIRFRLQLKNKFDGYFVPGKSGVKLLNFYGVSNDVISTGLYAADSSLFHDGRSLIEREKKILYVGQFCERKNVIALAEAFMCAHGPEFGWTLELCGCGPLKSSLPTDIPAIKVHDFVQPVSLSELYRTARIFALPSHEEHWGVVVHEAVLSGCVLLLSKNIGAGSDFLQTGVNGFTFTPNRVSDIAFAMRSVMSANDNWLLNAQRVSVEMSKNAGIEVFTEGLISLLKIISGS